MGLDIDKPQGCLFHDQPPPPPPLPRNIDWKVERIISMSLNKTLWRRSLSLTQHRNSNVYRQCCRLSSSNATSSLPPPTENPQGGAKTRPQSNEPREEDSALARRFTAMAEDALTASPRRASKIAEENEFPEDLKRQLEARIAFAEFKFTHATAIAAASLPSSAPKHTRDLASATPWTGSESTEDGVLRMLVDAHKPLRGDLARKQTPGPVASANIDLRPQRTLGPKSEGHRIARAKEKSAEYSLCKTGGLTDQERAEIRNMFRERFLPEGRVVASFQALASLADEKIEEARRRGQFDNLPNRGKPLERDHNAESPFLDTTEYLLNRIIKHQDIVPPWIEKQQELVSATRNFRDRLRVEWRRHVARSIASTRGGLEEQCRKAERYAQGEERLRRIEERTKRIEMGEETEDMKDAVIAGPMEVFRDPAWEAIELSYLKLAVETLNSTTRSYNLMAPEPARKPYFSLERELKNCFRDCAPTIAREIRDRATKPSVKLDFRTERSSGPGGTLGKLNRETAVVHDSTKPNYGFKEFWGDLWGKKRQPG